MSVQPAATGDQEPAQAEDGLVTYGPPARLGPVPQQIGEQPRKALEHVPDIALDWIDLDDQNGNMAVRAVSARGHMHRYRGEIRQDSFAIGVSRDVVVIAVADGVGSCSGSHVGSALAARRIVGDWDLIEEILGGVKAGEVSFEGIATYLRDESFSHSFTPRDVSTTLVVAIVHREPETNGHHEVVLAQIGDSDAWHTTGGGWAALGPGGDTNGGSAIFTTFVEPLPDHPIARVWQESFAAGETLALVSDGVGNILRMQPAYAKALAALWSETSPSPASLLKVVDATVKSFDDDRTFVGVRFS
ncbi:Serine/threonine protein phosphatase PrpC [Actinopolymorpha cephalotaxi]|uniref:Serine/threonine protein phosphatase PrpC n=1 Tax=Actinopolymorpha cephalotaxi TaxID=504797 RepID=A0A1I3A5I7_9ACTN|nr:protein phosphatase 2C domain-containing protein [Actinopolymorpha cephalotaxi]NYH85367.1 serine/threonine protein phosphatase PrpC [Actinopolymorpha cephalotaxi]SFH44561.1 Serine/threonine protein phosphatase PrpC [Actinopolymorpha cephalotaxi]